MIIEKKGYTEIWLSKKRYKRIFKENFICNEYCAYVNNIFYFKKINESPGFYLHSKKTPSIIRIEETCLFHWYRNNKGYNPNGASNIYNLETRKYYRTITNDVVSEESYWND